MTKEDILEYFKDINGAYNECTRYDDLSRMLDMLAQQEPCEDVCEWFEQYVDIVTDIVELRFSDGTVKRAKRGLYMRDIEKSIRKMLIDQIVNEKKQEQKWIPVSERLPEEKQAVLVWCPQYKNIYCAYLEKEQWWIFGAFVQIVPSEVVAWMPLPEPYKADRSEGK